MKNKNQVVKSISRRGFVKLMAFAFGASLASPLLASCTAEKGKEYEVDIVIQQNEILYSPETLTVPRGATVTWLNKSYYSQSATCDPQKASNGNFANLPRGSQPWDSGPLYPGQRFSKVFDTPGTYIYFSLPKLSAGTMGTIIVQ
ncbi:MAG: plastocyanin/azurin family copper-binding protein [Bacteroidota bacterium]